MKGIKLQDVAQRAGVSASTVTRVVRGSGYVSPETRERVEAAIRELGYIAPQRADTSFVKPYVIIISPSGDSGNLLFQKIQEKLCLALQAQGWLVLPYFIHRESPSEMVRAIDRMRGPGLMGVVFNCIDNQLDLLSMRRYLVSLPTCIVMVERSPDIYGLNKVMLNAREMVFIAIRHLAHLGHRHIAYFAVDDDREVERSRKEGFLFGINAMNIAEESHLMPIDDYLCRDGYRGMERYLKTYGLPTAVIANDTVMVGVSNYLYRMGCRVPQDISLMGMDDTNACYATPRLTSIAYPLEEMIQNIMRILQEYQAGRTLPQNVLLSTTLVDRGTCAAPRRATPGEDDI